ncbi:hypothetical protein, partial [Gordonia jinhuaensis]|uniref:hypothetical protein n=1 Tax=Gordonia jinhuaensis TaxID=1517702 RepID=UPI001E4341CC
KPTSEIGDILMPITGLNVLNTFHHTSKADRWIEAKVKTVTSRWPSGIKDGAEFTIPTMQ